MKVCYRCKIEKPLTDFSPRTKRGRGVHSRCKKCHVEELNAWRKANPGYDKKRDERRRYHRRTVVLEYLSSHVCVDCGQKDQRVLEFDHIKERGPKLFNIGEVAGNLTVKAIIEEIAKCEVRCANCHRIKTAERNPAHWSHRYPELFGKCTEQKVVLAGSQGVEPRPGEPKPPVLPLHHEPIKRGRTPGLQLLLI